MKGRERTGKGKEGKERNVCVYYVISAPSNIVF